MNNLIKVLAASLVALPVGAEPIIERWKTPHAQGCMMLLECKTGVIEITSAQQLAEQFPNSPYDQNDEIMEETENLIVELNKMGVKVFLGEDKYFMSGVAGVYHTVGNNFFLNRTWADDPETMIRTFRHEAWHAAQDAMAGTIDNSLIAIIRPEESVPRGYVIATEAAYADNPAAIPWEKEAKWAGGTPGMTLEVLRIINRTEGKPWLEIEPTPLTRQYLENNGYL